jgi:F0F1-type ATP synthase membrane subunit a
MDYINLITTNNTLFYIDWYFNSADTLSDFKWFLPLFILFGLEFFIAYIQATIFCLLIYIYYNEFK